MTTISLPQQHSHESTGNQHHSDVPQHPLGSKAKVLFTSVFGPYAQDDEFGSRQMNPMELYHNQVTRVQGPFSLRMFHRSWGIMMIRDNISNPTTLLDFPTLDRFIEEITTNKYDVIGITSIMPNMHKAKHMCELIRKHQPNATIVIGGHIANVHTLPTFLDADHIVRGEGIGWFRQFLGQDVDAPIKHPRILSGFGTRSMGITLRDKPGDVAASLIPSVGCPLGCNFCSTSHMFGGKGKFIEFYQTGEQIFEIMCDLERELKVNSFFIMDENFLIHRQKALRILELMQEHDKAWALYVFSSANVLRTYTMEQLIGLGISWVWMGLEGKDSKYTKLKNIDAHELIRNLQANGIRVLGSSIVGMEEHTPENVDEAFDYSASFDTEFHQFMLYTPIPGTPLWKEHEEAGTLVDPDCKNTADSHGQLKFSHIHPNIPAGMETEMLVRAFTRDFEVNGPSVIRVFRTTLRGFRKHRNHPDARVRRRYHQEGDDLAVTGAAAVWACRKWFKGNQKMWQKMDDLLAEFYHEFGIKSRIMAPLAGRYIYNQIKKEQTRLDAGWTYEPQTFYEKANQPDAHTAPIRTTFAVGNWTAPMASAQV
jgi:radical SAM superfamily enzyme YgiQ (UPF0313 family)